MAIPVVAAGPRPVMRELWRHPYFVRAASVAIVLTMWQLIGAQLPPMVISTPGKVLSMLVNLIASGSLPKALGVSLIHFSAGLGASIVLGAAVGIAMAVSPFWEVLCEPYINALYSSPRVVFVPMVLLWLGMGWEAKAVLVFLGAVIPITLAIYRAIKYVDPQLMEVGRSFSLSRFQQMAYIMLPAALPLVVSGLRMGVGRAVVAMVNAELYLELSGLGGLLTSFGRNFDTPAVLAVIVTIALLGMFLVELLKWLEGRLGRWRTGAAIQR